MANTQTSIKMGGWGLEALICIKVTDSYKNLILKGSEMVKNWADEIAEIDFVQIVS